MPALQNGVVKLGKWHDRARNPIPSTNGFLGLFKCPFNGFVVRLAIGSQQHVFRAPIAVFEHRVNQTQVEQLGEFAVQGGGRGDVGQVHQLGHGHGFFAKLEKRNFIQQLLGAGVQVGDGFLIGQGAD